MQFRLGKAFAVILVGIHLIGVKGIAQSDEECAMCHSDKSLRSTRKSVHSLFVDQKKFGGSIHASVGCVGCHADISEVPHEERVKPAQCGSCHDTQQTLYSECLHGRARARGDRLAPSCSTCHGSHEIRRVKDPLSSVAPMRIPFLCGSCHREGSPVSRQRVIHQDSVLENYSESIHGIGLMKKGLTVSATCVSCHSAHLILPHTDSRSTIARKNIANTCAQCHTQIETVHRQVIRGELWEKQPHTLPACVDCHQPHKIRRVFYDQGMADRDCLQCHESRNLKANDGRSMFVSTDHMGESAHANTRCSQCHSGVNISKKRPCETITAKVDCASCHAQQVEMYQKSIHGVLLARNDANAPTCTECHGTHVIRKRTDSKSMTFPTRIPTLCAKCHREGQKAAVRYQGSEHNITDHYAESIHGKGLLKSGLVVTAMCTDCHTAHSALPSKDPLSSINHENVAKTCGKCHHGIEEQYEKSIHSPLVTKTEKQLPTCSDCHSAHTIRRTDDQGFKLTIMDQCGRCHETIAKTYFDTYHGKVSALGYTKTAKCYDCHGAHDILPVTDPKSRLSRENVVETCKSCHSGANRQFAGYLTHATHHDPDKYPILFWVFWGMTGLLIFTFVLSGLHTMLWLPRSLKWKREIQAAEEAERRLEESAQSERPGEASDDLNDGRDESE